MPAPMMADGSGSRALARVKRKNFFICAALMVISAALTYLPVFTFDVRLVPLLLVWAAGFVVVGVGVGAGVDRMCNPALEISRAMVRVMGRRL